MLKTFYFSILLITLLFTFANALMLHVPKDYPLIDSAIQSAVDGDTVLLAPGTYNETINFQKKKIILSSHFLLTGDSSFIENTVISDSCSQDSYRPSSRHFLVNMASTNIIGITFHDIESRISTLGPKIQICICRFTNSNIRMFSKGGNSIEFINNKILNCEFYFGGIEDTLIIKDNQFNISSIRLSGTGHTKIYAVIKGNTFSGNKFSNKSHNPYYSAAIGCSGTGYLYTEAFIEKNEFIKAGISLGGTGMASINTTIKSNTFEGDGKKGSGIECGGTGSCVVSTMIEFNRFYGANFSIGGTGKFVVNADLYRNIFTEFQGRAISLNRISLANYTCNLVNNTIVGNQTGIYYNRIGGLIIVNCIIWNNGTDLMNVNEEQISFSLWASGLNHTGNNKNISGNPMLIDPEKRNFGLLGDSPCIGAATETPFSIRIVRPTPDNPRPRPPIIRMRDRDIGAVPYQHPTISLYKGEFSDNTRMRPAIQGTVLYSGRLYNEIMIFDIRGRLIKRTGIQTDMVPMDLNELFLTSGTYIIRFVQDSNATSLRYCQK